RRLGSPDDHLRLGKRVGLHLSSDAGAAPCYFLRDQAAVQNAEPGPAVLLRDVGVHQAEVPRLAADVARELAGLVVVRRLRDDLLAGELARQGAKLLLLVRQGEIDHRAPPGVARPGIRMGRAFAAMDSDTAPPGGTARRRRVRHATSSGPSSFRTPPGPWRSAPASGQRYGSRCPSDARTDRRPCRTGRPR